MEELEFLVEGARGGQPLTARLIRQLHQLIARYQRAYAATDALGNPVEAPLHHGAWKRWLPHVRRPDGSLLQYVFPEQVEPQMVRLLELHRRMGGEHPVVRAA